MKKQTTETDKYSTEYGVTNSSLNVKWMIFSAITIFSQMIFAYYYSRNNDWHAGTTAGIVYGVLTLTGVLFLGFYRIRRATYRVKLGSMRWWYLGHIHVGFLSIIFLFLHTGYGLHGFFNSFLLFIYILVITSGIAGWFIFAMLPVSNARQIGAMNVESELVEDIESRSREIEEYLASKAQYFRVLADKYVGSSHKDSGITIKRMLMNERELLDQMRHNFFRMRSELPPQELYSLDFLQSLCIEREKYIVRVLRFKIMRAWLLAHVPLTVAMLTAITIHIISIWYF